MPLPSSLSRPLDLPHFNPPIIRPSLFLCPHDFLVFLVFFPTSVICSPTSHQHRSQVSKAFPFSKIRTLHLSFSRPPLTHHKWREKEQDVVLVGLPGGKLCFNLSALSESFNTSVYRNRLHRILNLMSEVLEDFLTRAAGQKTEIRQLWTAEKGGLWTIQRGLWEKMGESAIPGGSAFGGNVHFASFRREISMNCLMSFISDGMVGG